MVVDDSTDFGRLLEMLLGIEKDFECVGVLEHAGELEREARERRAEVIVLDLTMPGRDPLEALSELASTPDAARVIVHSGYDDPQIQERVEAAGARGMVAKHREPTVLMDAIRRVARGERVFEV